MDRWTALRPTRVQFTAADLARDPLLPLRTQRIGSLSALAWRQVLCWASPADVASVAGTCSQLARLAGDGQDGHVVWRCKLDKLAFIGPPLPASDASTAEAIEPEQQEADFDDFWSSDDGVDEGDDDEGRDGAEGEDESEAHGQRDDSSSSERDGKHERDDLISFAVDEQQQQCDRAAQQRTRRAPRRQATDASTATATSTTSTLTARSSRAAAAARARSLTQTQTRNEGKSAKERFRRAYSFLVPHYRSFRSHTTSALVFADRSLRAMDRARVLAALARMARDQAISPDGHLAQAANKMPIVAGNVRSASDFFESALTAEFEKADARADEPAMRARAAVLAELNGAHSLVQVFIDRRDSALFAASMHSPAAARHHDPLRNLVRSPDDGLSPAIDFEPMSRLMDDVCAVVRRDGALLARVFPPETDAVGTFGERIANDVLADYLATLLDRARVALPRALFVLAFAAAHAQCQRLAEALAQVSPRQHQAPDAAAAARANEIVLALFEPHMDDYLEHETECVRELLEQICSDWDSKTDVTTSTFLASQNPAMVKKNVLSGFTKALLLPVTISAKTASYGFNAMATGATTAFNTVASLPMWATGANASSPVDAAAAATADVAVQQDVASVIEEQQVATEEEQRNAPTFERLISLDTALQLIQSDRECLKRLESFAGYKGERAHNVRDAIESTFIALLHALGDRHVKPAFARAATQMDEYKPSEHDAAEYGGAVAPLAQFFELVHVGDTIQQMVDVYFDTEMDAGRKRDFMNPVVREKRRFDVGVDDAVAQGLNAGVNILMSQAEHIIQRQDPRDFCPDTAQNGEIDLRPTETCRDAIACLSSHCAMLRGIMDKHILEVFYQEVGIRLHTILLKHIKTVIVSVDGGFRLIADLNAYHQFVVSLRQSSVTTYFTALKMVGELFIVDSAKDLGQLARDPSRYEGTLSPDDLYEICQRRADWRVIGKQVEKALFGFRATEDCIVV